MGKGIGVPFVADVKDFLKGTGQVEDALDGVIDSLDGVAREGKRSADLIETSFEGMSEEVQAADRRLEAKFDAFFESVERDSDTASSKMEREFKSAFDSVERSAKSSGDKASKAISDIPDETRGKAKGKFAFLGEELGGEFSQNIGEGISSGKTGVAGALDTMLGTLGGVLPALGPAGALVGVGALVVGSIVQGILNNQEEVRKAIQQTMSDAVDAAADIFDNGPKTRSIGEIIKGFSPQEKQDLTDSGIALYDAADAIKTYEDSGDPSKINALKKPLNDRADAIKNVGVASDNLFGSNAPSLFEVGGPLVSDPAAAQALDNQTASIKARSDALAELQRRAALVDIQRLRSIRQELNRPINQSNSSLARYLN